MTVAVAWSALGLREMIRAALEGAGATEPLAAVAQVMHEGLRRRQGWDPNVGSRLLRMFEARGLVDLDVLGESRTMHGNHESGQWRYLGIEHAADLLVAHGAVTRDGWPRAGGADRDVS